MRGSSALSIEMVWTMKKTLGLCCFLLLFGALLYLFLAGDKYDVSLVPAGTTCFKYKDERDVIVLAAFAIKSHLGEDELERQHKLSISYRDDSEYIVRGSPGLPLLKYFYYGGGAAVAHLRKEGLCLVVGEVYLEK